MDSSTGYSIAVDVYEACWSCGMRGKNVIQKVRLISGTRHSAAGVDETRSCFEYERSAEGRRGWQPSVAKCSRLGSNIIDNGCGPDRDRGQRPIFHGVRRFIRRNRESGAFVVVYNSTRDPCGFGIFCEGRQPVNNGELSSKDGRPGHTTWKNRFSSTTQHQSEGTSCQRCCHAKRILDCTVRTW